MNLSEEHREAIYRRWRTGESGSSTLIELFDTLEKGLVDWNLSEEKHKTEAKDPLLNSFIKQYQ